MTTLRAIALMFFGYDAYRQVAMHRPGYAAVCVALAAAMVALEVRAQMRSADRAERERRRRVVEDAQYADAMRRLGR